MVFIQSVFTYKRTADIFTVNNVISFWQIVLGFILISQPATSQSTQNFQDFFAPFPIIQPRVDHFGAIMMLFGFASIGRSYITIDLLIASSPIIVYGAITIYERIEAALYGPVNALPIAVWGSLIGLLFAHVWHVIKYKELIKTE